jgi:hypothetical protein
MAAVSHLVTFVDIDDRNDDGPEGRSMSVRARHEAVLADGRHVLLLDDRGWGGTQAWKYETVNQMKRTARTVVGPDEPFAGRTRAEMEAGHWATLASTMRRHGIEVDAAELRALRHDVELSERVLARIPPGRKASTDSAK